MIKDVCAAKFKWCATILDRLPRQHLGIKHVLGSVMLLCSFESIGLKQPKVVPILIMRLLFLIRIIT